MRNWPTLIFDSVTVLPPGSYIYASSANDQGHESAHRETTIVVNEAAVNSNAFIFDSMIGIGLLVLVWVFLSWTYPPTDKSTPKRNLTRTKIS